MTHDDSIGVAVVQSAAEPRSPQESMDSIAAQVCALTEDGANLVVLPEFAVTGYDLELDYRALARNTAEPTIEWLRHLAVTHRATVVTAIPRLDEAGTLRDASVVVTPEGTAHLGGKRYLWGAERGVFESAPRSGLLTSTPVGMLGVVVCYEAGFPETVRELARAGADLIAVPAAFGLARLHIWRLLTRARAAENGCIVVAAGLCGGNRSGSKFAGHSTIVDPYGRRLTELGTEPGRAIARIPAEAVGLARAEVPYLADLERLGGVTTK